MTLFLEKYNIRRSLCLFLEDVIEFMMLINDPKVTFNPTLKDIAFDMSAAALPESHRF